MPMDFSEASQLLWLHLQPLNADIAFVAPIPGLSAETLVLGMVLVAFAQDPSAVDGFRVDSCCAPLFGVMFVRWRYAQVLWPIVLGFPEVFCHQDHQKRRPASFFLFLSGDR